MVMDQCEIQPGEHHCDLGSGDARLCIAAAQRGAFSTGIERDAELVQKSRQRVAALGLSERITILQGDYWQMDWSLYDVLTTGNCSDALCAVIREAFLRRARPWARLLLGVTTPRIV
jgi:cyclopropane fatty-acyl-phospholipid synthase-like methyltransferase